MTSQAEAVAKSPVMCQTEDSALKKVLRDAFFAAPCFYELQQEYSSYEEYCSGVQRGSTSGFTTMERKAFFRLMRATKFKE